MNTTPRSQNPGWTASAFTLIELIVVIGVIAVLAAMIFPIAGAANKKAKLTRAKAEMVLVETAIEGYKTKLGYYPPDNAPNWAFNQLYFELLGTTNIGSGGTVVYETLDGSAKISQASLASVFSPPGTISGFMNVSKGGEEGAVAQNYLKNLKPGQVSELKNTGSDVVRVLAGPVPWPDNNPYHPINANNPTINPWSYNSSNPRFNHGTFDLWIDIIINGQTNRVCNWSDRPILVSTPY